MDTWFFIITCLCCAALITIRSLLFHQRDGKKLPPGPSSLSSNCLVLTNFIPELQPILRNLKSTYGPLITVSIGSHPLIIVGSHSLAHQMLIQKGTVFADRPRSLPFRNITSASYGPTWRVLRRNLSSEFLHPSCIKSYSWARKWALHILTNRLQQQKGVAGIKVADHMNYAVFSLLVLMCFGEKLNEHRINEIASIQRRSLYLAATRGFNVIGNFPRLGKILFRNTWKGHLKMMSDQEKVLIPLIKSRIDQAAISEQQSIGDEKIVTYVDTLVNLKLPEEDAKDGGKLTQKEMVSMCSEFLNAGTGTTSTALQWIMANLVQYHDIQRKLYDDIIAVVGPWADPEISLYGGKLKTLMVYAIYNFGHSFIQDCDGGS